MELTRTHIWLMTLMVLVGAGLVYVGLFAGGGLVWAVAGFYFLAVAAVALVATMARIVGGPIGAFLRRRGVSMIMLAFVLVLLVLTVFTSQLGNIFPGR